MVTPTRCHTTESSTNRYRIRFIGVIAHTLCKHAAHIQHILRHASGPASQASRCATLLRSPAQLHNSVSLISHAAALPPSLTMLPFPLTHTTYNSSHGTHGPRAAQAFEPSNNSYSPRNTSPHSLQASMPPERVPSSFTCRRACRRRLSGSATCLLPHLSLSLVVTQPPARDRRHEERHYQCDALLRCSAGEDSDHPTIRC